MTRALGKVAVVLLAGVCQLPAQAGWAQQVDRIDMSDPTPTEVALATECRDTYTKMRALEKQVEDKRKEVMALNAKEQESRQELDELKAKFEKLSTESQTSEEAYEAAVKAQKAYETAATGHNAIITEHTDLTKQHILLMDEYHVVNPSYVSKCSGTIFKAKSVILTCKDEKSDWCDLLK